MKSANSLHFFLKKLASEEKMYYLCTRKRKTNKPPTVQTIKNCRKGNKKIPNVQIILNKNY